MYLYGIDATTGLSLKAEPCLMCSRIIKNSGIEKVICSKADVLDKWIAGTKG
jgi:tRNA(Arg) A34 adenosine deaminase TadA